MDDLYLESNPIVTVARVLADDPALKTITRFHYQKIDVIRLFRALETNNHLTSLKFSATIDCETASYMQHSLKRNSTLKHLDLCLCTFEADSISILTKSLRNNSSLLSLNLAFCWISRRESRGPPQIFKNLSRNTHLRELDISGLKLTHKNLSDALKCFRINSTLTTLKLARTSADINLVIKIMIINSTLTSLDLRANRYSIAGIKNLCSVLKTNTTLRILNLGDNNINEEGVSYLASTLHQNSTLKELSLQGNGFGTEGVMCLVAANPSLTKLDLRDNPINNMGVMVLSEMLLRSRASLSHLDVRACQINSEGLEYLTQALSKYDLPLTELHIGNNDLGQAGAFKLAKMLLVNTTLTSLDIREIKAGRRGAASLFRSLRRNSTLTNLCFTVNSIDEEVAQIVGTTLKCNITLTYLDIRVNQIAIDGTNFIIESCQSLRSLYLDPRIANMMSIMDILENNSSLTELSLTAHYRDAYNTIMNFYLERNRDNMRKIESLFEKMLVFL